LIKAEQIFLAHLSILKAYCCHGKNIGANQMYIPPLLDELKLEAQVSFFKVTMLANSAVAMKPPLDCNPCFRMWALLSANQIICSKLSEWLKLVELSMAMVLGSVEDDRCFSNLSFTKSKLRN
jgi:hypothetical protein